MVPRISAVLLIGACARTVAVDEPTSFDPRAYPTECAIDSDCVVADVIVDCRSCCSSRTAVRGGDASADLALVEQTCRSKGRAECALGCGPSTAACVDRKCKLVGMDASTR